MIAEVTIIAIGCVGIVATIARSYERVVAMRLEDARARASSERMDALAAQLDALDCAHTSTARRVEAMQLASGRR